MTVSAFALVVVLAAASRPLAVLAGGCTLQSGRCVCTDAEGDEWDITSLTRCARLASGGCDVFSSSMRLINLTGSGVLAGGRQGHTEILNGASPSLYGPYEYHLDFCANLVTAAADTSACIIPITCAHDASRRLPTHPLPIAISHYTNRYSLFMHRGSNRYNSYTVLCNGTCMGGDPLRATGLQHAHTELKTSLPTSR
jgi:hypothetical protein